MSTWRDSARCAGFDPEMWFPVAPPGRPAGGLSREIEELRAFCTGCPVIAPCLEEALRLNAEGFWGGLTEAERAQIRGRKARVGSKAADPLLEQAMAEAREARRRPRDQTNPRAGQGRKDAPRRHVPAGALAVVREHEAKS